MDTLPPSLYYELALVPALHAGPSPHVLMLETEKSISMASKINIILGPAVDNFRLDLYSNIFNGHHVPATCDKERCVYHVDMHQLFTVSADLTHW